MIRRYITAPYYSRFETLGISLAVSAWATSMSWSGFYAAVGILAFTAIVTTYVEGRSRAP